MEISEEEKKEDSTISPSSSSSSAKTVSAYASILERSTRLFQTLLSEEILRNEKLKAKALEDYVSNRIAYLESKVRKSLKIISQK